MVPYLVGWTADDARVRQVHPVGDQGRRRIGLGVLAFVRVDTERDNGEAIHALEDAIRGLPEVIACHYISGAGTLKGKRNGKISKRVSVKPGCPSKKLRQRRGVNDFSPAARCPRSTGD